MPSTILGAAPFEAVGNVIATIIILGVVVYVLVNVVFSGKKEIGSEIEVAANRKPYLGDEELESRKLDRSLTIALVVLGVIAIALPLYWILEPGRQSNAKEDFGAKFVKEGAAMFAPTAQGGFNCAGCHGAQGVGGLADYNLTQPDGTIKPVKWKAPALNTVLLRYSREEVTFILTYGRPFSPMPAWGTAGGGPLNDQQIQNLIDYLESIQLTPDEAQQQARDGLAKMMQVKKADGTPMYASEGEALFNMGLGADVAGGAYSCARCHTQGWSYASSFDEVRSLSGCGALGPSLCGSSLEQQFPAKPVNFPCKATADAPGTDPVCNNPFQDQIDFITQGSENGKKYGVHGQGSGKMPGFGQRPAEPALFWINKGKEREAGPGMMPPDLIEKIVEYERSL